VTDQFGRLDANVEHNANTLLWALDNWILPRKPTRFLRLKNGKFDVRRTLARGQWGASQNDVGRVFRNSNESALHVDLVPTPYFFRHPGLTRTRGSYEFLGGAADDLNAVWPVRPTRGVNRGYQAGILRDDGTLARFSAACAPTVYRGDRLPAELSGNVLVADPSGNLVSRIVVTDDGTSLRGKKAYDRGEFIASTDERFRPSICRRPRTGRCTSSISIAASSSTAASSPSICAIRSSRDRSNSRPGAAASGESCTTRSGGAPIRPSTAPRRARWSRRCRIRTAGGATPRSSCSSSVTTRPRSSR
jgi:hypothetical protein